MKSPLQNAEDKKFLWYHLSLPHMRPHGIKSIRKLYRAFPSSPTKVQQSRSERNSTPGFTALHRPTALWRNGWVCTNFHPRVLCIYFLTFYHFCLFKSMRNTEKVQENTENMQQTARDVFVSDVSANAPSKEIVGEAFRLPQDGEPVPYGNVERNRRGRPPGRPVLHTIE